MPAVVCGSDIHFRLHRLAAALRSTSMPVSARDHLLRRFAATFSISARASRSASRIFSWAASTLSVDLLRRRPDLRLGVAGARLLRLLRDALRLRRAPRPSVRATRLPSHPPRPVRPAPPRGPRRSSARAIDRALDLRDHSARRSEEDESEHDASQKSCDQKISGKLRKSEACRSPALSAVTPPLNRRRRG